MAKVQFPQAASVAWTGEQDVLPEQLFVGDRAYMHNPYYLDGTRLRDGPMRDSAFNGTCTADGSNVANDVWRRTAVAASPTVNLSCR